MAFPGFRERHTKSMSKKLLWILFIAILLLFAGGFLYWKMAHVPPPSSPVATNWPAYVPSPAPNSPANPPGRPASPPAAAEPSIRREPAAVEPGFVLRPGETLEYDANVTKLNSTVARLKISAIEKRTTAGKGIWHLQALAHTENPYRMIFELDDQFDSYSDAGTMTSVQYEMHLSERGQKVDSVQRMLSSMRDPVPPGGSAARVLPGTRDPLGMLEYLRSVEWGRTSEVQSPVYDGHKLYDVRAVLVGQSAAVSVPAGNFNTTKIVIHVLDIGAAM